jgi:hypothetical protein
MQSQAELLVSVSTFAYPSVRRGLARIIASVQASPTVDGRFWWKAA